MPWQGSDTTLQLSTPKTAISGKMTILSSILLGMTTEKGPGPLGWEGGREGGRAVEAFPLSLLGLKADGGAVDHSFVDSLGADSRERTRSAAHERCL